MIKSVFIMDCRTNPTHDLPPRFALGTPKRQIRLIAESYPDKLYATFWEDSMDLKPDPKSFAISPKHPKEPSDFIHAGYNIAVYSFIEKWMRENPSFKYAEIVNYHIVEQIPETTQP